MEKLLSELSCCCSFLVDKKACKAAQQTMGASNSTDDLIIDTNKPFPIIKLLNNEIFDSCAAYAPLWQNFCHVFGIAKNCIVIKKMHPNFTHMFQFQEPITYLQDMVLFGAAVKNSNLYLLAKYNGINNLMIHTYATGEEKTVTHDTIATIREEAAKQVKIESFKDVLDLFVTETPLPVPQVDLHAKCTSMVKTLYNLPAVIKGGKMWYSFEAHFSARFPVVRFFGHGLAIQRVQMVKRECTWYCKSTCGDWQLAHKFINATYSGLVMLNEITKIASIHLLKYVVVHISAAIPRLETFTVTETPNTMFKHSLYSFLQLPAGAFPTKEKKQAVLRWKHHVLGAVPLYFVEELALGNAPAAVAKQRRKYTSTLGISFKLSVSCSLWDLISKLEHVSLSEKYKSAMQQMISSYELSRIGLVGMVGVGINKIYVDLESSLLWIVFSDFILFADIMTPGRHLPLQLFESRTKFCDTQLLFNK